MKGKIPLRILLDRKIGNLATLKFLSLYSYLLFPCHELNSSSDIEYIARVLRICLL